MRYSRGACYEVHRAGESYFFHLALTYTLSPVSLSLALHDGASPKTNDYEYSDAPVPQKSCSLGPRLQIGNPVLELEFPAFHQLQW